MIIKPAGFVNQRICITEFPRTVSVLPWFSFFIQNACFGANYSFPHQWGVKYMRLKSPPSHKCFQDSSWHSGRPNWSPLKCVYTRIGRITTSFMLADMVAWSLASNHSISYAAAWVQFPGFVGNRPVVCRCRTPLRPTSGLLQRSAVGQTSLPRNFSRFNGRSAPDCAMLWLFYSFA